MSNRDINYVKLLTEESSFQLVRTNPKLTGNVKLTINESGGMWLDSIKVSPELSTSLYSKVAIDTTKSHPANLFMFFNNGSTPNEIVFDLAEQVDTTKTSKNFKDQYDFSHYFSGAKYLASNKYVERMSYFAPLYLKEEVPDYFIVFKITDPANFPLNQVKQKYINGETKTDYLIDLFNNASIIKTFDLRAETVPGKYLRNYINNVNFPKSPLTVLYEENDFTTWNGILLDEGIFGSRGELIHDLYTAAQPLKFFEENITNGFSRNGVIFPNILNLEFVFNDDTSNTYDFNRYLGMYVNAIELTKLDIDLNRAYLNRGTWENEPHFRKNFLETDEVSLTQSNLDGVIVPFKNSKVNISEFRQTFTDSDNLFINYINDKDGRLYMPKLSNPFEIEYSSSQSAALSLIEFKVADSISISTPGTGYSTLNNVTTTATLGSGSGLIVNITDDGLGGIASVVIVNGGTNYALGDTVTVNSGAGNAILQVNSVLSGTTVNANLTSHGYETGNLIVISSTDSEYAGEFLITTVDSDNFEYTVASVPTNATATCTSKKELSTGQFRFANNKIDLGLFFGQSRTNFLQDLGASTKVAGKSHAVIKINYAGRVSNFNLSSPGTGYTSAIGVDTTSSVGTGLTLDVIDDGAGGILSATINQPGSGYQVGDVITIDGGNSNATITVSAVINASLDNYDEIKLYHPNGTRLDSIGKYDLIISTQLYSLIPNPGEYYVYNDYDNVLGYDEFYMNGGGTAEQIATALAGCINGIRSRTFTAYQYNDRVFIKVNSPGDFDNLHKISFFSPVNEYSVITINSTNTGSSLIGSVFSFMGGSKETGNRLIIDAGHLSKIEENFDSILVKSSDSWSKIRKVSPWVDEITETNSTTPALRSATLSNYDNKLAIVLDENETPTVSNKEFLMRPKFRPSFGLLSFYLIKDLDFDFYSSTYANFPNIDLYQHYYIPENLNLLEPGIDYIVYGGNIKVDDGTPIGIIHLAGSSFTAPFLTSYSAISGSPLVTYDPSSTSAVIAINDNNNELDSFNGFSILKDPSKIVPQDTSNEYLLKTKYLNGLTVTEYDYYKENESLDFALRSKIIPYITKWGIKNGKDSRDNPYRLNTELIFGRNNFSPDHEDKSQNPINFTHEWFYIESKFNYVYDESTAAQNTNYFETPLDETSLLSDPDYFINYFTYTPTSLVGKEVADTQFRYSSLYKNSANQYEAFFKGFKLTFKDVTDPDVIGADGKPVAKTITTRFDGYKFSCILKPILEDINDHTKPPIKYRVIEHKDYKFIVVIIEVYIGSIDDIDDYWKDFGLFGTSQVNPSNFTSTTPSTSVDYFDSINGDYRIAFDQVSNLTHTLLYSLKNKKYNTLLNSFSTTKMGSKLNFASTGFNGSDYTIRALANANTPNYIGSLTDDIINPTDSTLIFMKDLSTNFDVFMSSLVGFVPVFPPINPIDYSLEKFIHYDGANYGVGLILPPASIYGILPTSTVSFINQNFAFKVMTGGEGYFERLFGKISFAKFKSYVNSLDDIIEYSSYSLDSNGVSSLNTDPNFYLEILDTSYVEKQNQLITNYTTSIPIQFSGQEEIGTDYEVANLPLKYELNRYKGEYEPVIKNYSIYQSNYKFKKNTINDLSLSNTKINSEISNFLTIQHFNHIKVADSQILVLESDESYLPIYPKISEVAIGQGEYFLLRGNWDWGFHYRYSNKEQYSPVSGALRIEEDDSFLAKLINLPELIELNDFKIEFIDPALEFNSVDISKIEIVAKETPNSVDGIINVNNVLTRYLIEDGISAKFNEYLINSSEYIGNFTSISDPDINVSSYVREYIKLNILKLYDIDINEFYAKLDTSVVPSLPQEGTNPNSIEFVFLDDKQRFTKGYDILTSLQINKIDKLILRFSFLKRPGSGLLVSPKIKIKFI
ncbi:hypothetical protein UFOVP972_334 [uncultured Caudovirales phage]|uniref:Uncharacterized protein n=1 Tax=uncultured Caudovirales phage TaxID=2100421 RepID=A0A6J5PV93_9CAUD|nr:hypothetical protein UFOVP972_334 [uncultured Caudovirales phage]